MYLLLSLLWYDSFEKLIAAVTYFHYGDWWYYLICNIHLLMLECNVSLHTVRLKSLCVFLKSTLAVMLIVLLSTRLTEIPANCILQWNASFSSHHKPIILLKGKVISRRPNSYLICWQLFNSDPFLDISQVPVWNWKEVYKHAQKRRKQI